MARRGWSQIYKKDMTPLFLSDMPDEKARATPPEVVVPYPEHRLPSDSDT